MGTTLVQKTMILISLKLNKAVLYLFLLLASGLFFPTAHAQDSVVLSVSPTLFEMTANKTQTWSSTVRVINANPFPITVYTETVNFEPTGEVGQGTLIPVFDAEAAGDTLAEWITVETGEITIPAEQTLSVPFTISVPDDAAPGGHFAAILVGTRSLDSGDDQPQVETSQVVTSLVFLSVAGDIMESGNIREFSSSQAVYESTDATFSLRFENTGNVHIQPQGEIEIRNMWGQLRGRVPINKNSQFGNVLPESIRSYTFHWSSEWSLADVGRHTAITTLAYGEDTRQFADAKTTFWVIPWKILLLTVLVLGGFIALVVWSIKLYVRRMLQLAGVTPELHKQQRNKSVSVVAPIEAGILDLRDELEHGDGSIVARLWSFVKAYRAFAVVAVALLVFVGLLLWYLILMITSDFAYEVHYEQPDGTAVQIADSDQGTSNEPIQMEVAQLTVVNHSGLANAVALIESKLEDGPYQLVEVAELYEGTKERSVLVYDPAYLDVVTDLQARLPGVLVSSFVSEDKTDPPIVLYVGTDLVSE